MASWQVGWLALNGWTRLEQVQKINQLTHVYLTDWMSPTRHKIDNFRDVLPSQPLGILLKKLNLTEANNARRKAKQEKNAKPKQSKKINLNLNQHSSLLTVCAYHCAHNTAQNISDNFPSYPSDNHHSSDDVYWRGKGHLKMMINMVPMLCIHRRVKLARTEPHDSWVEHHQTHDVCYTQLNIDT